MKTISYYCAAALAALLVSPVSFAGEPVKPGAEHEMLKKMEGTWDTTMKAAGQEFKGTVTYKMELGGLWLCGKMESDCPEGRFTAVSMETYNAKKQKYENVWFDSKSCCHMMMEGTCDKESKTATFTGECEGKDGKPSKCTAVYQMVDDNTINFTMRMGDDKEPTFTVLYTRRK